LDILDIALPTAAAYSGGSSETLGQCIFGTTSVCPGRSGSISARDRLGLELPQARLMKGVLLPEKCDDVVVLTNSISVRSMVNYLTESTLSVFLPKFWDGLSDLRLDNERSHDQYHDSVEVLLFGTWAATLG